MLNWGEFQILVGMNEKEKQKHSVKSEVQGQRILFFQKKEVMQLLDLTCSILGENIEEVKLIWILKPEDAILSI